MVIPIADAVTDYTESKLETEGDYATEQESSDAFLSAITATECFTIYQQVNGWYFGASAFGDKATGIIDFVLTPKKKLIDKGWAMGCVGVEVKKSGHKAGPLICQMIDYSKAVFRLPETSGSVLVCMTAICAFPAFDTFGAIQSVLANHRCGVVNIAGGGLALKVANTNIFDSRYGQISVKGIACGYKNGSR